MNTRASQKADLPLRLKDACERLLHPSVAAGEERERQLRLVQVLLAAPVLAALATAEIAVRQVGMAGSLVAVALVFGLGLLVPLALIATAKRQLMEPLALLLAPLALGALLAAAGGPASPLAVLSAAIAIEAGWIGRTRRAVAFGLAAAAGAVAIGAGIPAAFAAGTVAPSAWQWLVPLVYATTLLARLHFAAPASQEVASEPPSPALEEMVGTAVLRLQASGDVTYASSKVEALLGVAPEMLMGTGLFDRIHVADRIAWLSALTDIREGAGARLVGMRVRVPAKKPGLPAQALYRNFTCDLMGEAGEGRVIALLRQDADTAALEQTLAETRRMAELAMHSKDQILASVSHELRTPLNAIVGFSDILANEMFGKFANDRQREYVEMIREAGNHLLSVVNAILDVSKVESGAYGLQAESFSFEDAARFCVAMAAQQAEAKPLRLKAEIAKDIGAVHGDRRAVQQVLINLLSNAVKFTPAGEVKLTARRSGDRLEFTVSDTGIGISAEDLEHVGTPFMQVRNDYTRKCQGTGLGLALVKGLVRLQGGGMSIESAPGTGTQVHISLPAGPVDAEHGTEETGIVHGGANWNGGWYDDTLRKTA
ncbi:PAS domain-containing sensor histidine kinase [Chelativorans sp. AA-79]|uniref:PAS domain-containing sensor histidine kinase n=1 Tax=Chelativorans sp. AA-79 TaxID=3028735 RepID=UPI0023F8FB92|nr:PAS domain-containing sensor histidine kinase [Chelativorans sp. AA-79]WEX07746.1 PAS domain-containing sensor histidine kinase [Chelativorans sp. AA-79]